MLRTAYAVQASSLWELLLRGAVSYFSLFKVIIDDLLTHDHQVLLNGTYDSMELRNSAKYTVPLHIELNDIRCTWTALFEKILREVDAIAR